MKQDFNDLEIKKYMMTTLQVSIMNVNAIYFCISYYYKNGHCSRQYLLFLSLHIDMFPSTYDQNDVSLTFRIKTNYPTIMYFH